MAFTVTSYLETKKLAEFRTDHSRPTTFSKVKETRKALGNERIAVIKEYKIERKKEKTH